MADNRRPAWLPTPEEIAKEAKLIREENNETGRVSKAKPHGTTDNMPRKETLYALPEGMIDNEISTPTGPHQNF